MFSIAQCSLIIFGICIVLFVTEWLPMATTAILGCVMMVVFGIAPFEVVFGQFASSSVILVISMMIVGKAMFETGAAQLMGGCIMKLSGGSERRILLVSILLCALVSAFMSNVATLAIFISVLNNLSTKESKIDRRNLMLPIAMASVIGGACTLIGSAPQITAQGLLEETVGRGFDFFDYAPMGIILVLALVLYVMVIGYPMGKRIWAHRKNEDMEEGDGCPGQAVLVDKRKMGIVFTIFIIMGILFFLEPFPIAVIGAAAALSCIITGCISQKKALSGVCWSSVGKLAGCLGIMQAVNKSGGGQLIGDMFFKLAGKNIPPHLLFALMVILVIVLSEFLTNSTALLIVLPMAISVCPGLGLNIYAFAMGITLGSSVALATPLSCTPLTMVTSYGYGFKDFVRYSLPFDIAAGILIISLVPVFYPLYL